MVFFLPSFSNILFREFALIAMWRVPATPVGAHTLLSFLAEPLKHLSENPDTLEDYVSENLQEFQAWVCFTLHFLLVVLDLNVSCISHHTAWSLDDF